MDESYAVGWGALALLNANIAQLKGRTGLGALCGSLRELVLVVPRIAVPGSLLGGPLATLLLALVERR
jgi:hypothetical protein